ncbi:MAG: hypothetical protein CUN55_10595 [Phototrophicales bacterium]|nr:MAG: hypothetical protein CUN55_10595 [Phototrophicales bacterium]
MQRIRELWLAFRNFAIIFSFIMNFVLIIILLFVVYLIFDIKNGIAEPLIDGLHRNFVGLNEAEIETTVVVDDEIPIDFDLTVQDRTVVTLAEPATINNVPAQFEITGGGGSISGTVDITLPAGTPLTIDLTLLVPVEQQIPVVLNVPVDIALKDTQLSVPFTNLRNLFEPYVKILDNLPSSWDEVPEFAFDALNGEVNLVQETEGSRNPWPPDGFTRLPQPVEDDAASEDIVPADNTVPTEATPMAPERATVVPTPTVTPYVLPTQTPSTESAP